MVRIMMRGGVWKNTEDEILKAAVMKYGKHNWARVASLLPRKSAKQCKARWYEWLDPSIKKTEWSREEDEKLLHLAKLMPNQWRTIAPLVGRTARMCLDRYEKLLDAAQDLDGDASAADDPRRLRPGEIDPAPETKPARPDPIDMDEDEKEMLSEARARLANTKGKKAKRKAREKQLEEARRLASLQKRRELKAAGIVQRRHARRTQHVDYEHEIPFHQKVPAGFFDTSEEEQRSREMSRESHVKNFERLRTDRMADKKREAERRKAQKDDQKEAQKMAVADPVKRAQMSQKANALPAVRARTALSLPSPQVTDAELEDIARLGQQAQSAMSSSGSQDVTRALLGELSAKMATPTPMRTPRQVGNQDALLQEAKLQRALITQQTPLLRGDGEAAEAAQAEVDLTAGTGFQGATPMRSSNRTPHPSSMGEGTPARPGSVRMAAGATPQATPLRDGLGLNEAAIVTEEPKRKRRRKGGQVSEIAAGLSALPEPENEVTLELPELPPEEDTETKEAVEDAEVVEEKRQLARQEEQKKLLARRSSVVKQQLPRPSQVDVKALLKTVEREDDVEELVQEEMIGMMARDARDFPVSVKESNTGLGLTVSAAPKEEGGRKKKKKGRKAAKRDDLDANAEAIPYVEYADEELEKAREMIQVALKELPNPSAARFAEAWKRQSEALIDTKEGYREVATLRREELTDALFQHHAVHVDCLAKKLKKAEKVEGKLQIHLNGYINKASQHEGSFQELAARLDATLLELHSCRVLAQQEAKALPQRLRDADTALQSVMRREMDLQRIYQILESYRNELVEAMQKATVVAEG